MKKNTDMGTMPIRDLIQSIRDNIKNSDPLMMLTMNTLANRMEQQQDIINALLELTTEYQDTISDVLELATEYGGIDGAHHKQYGLDQIIRAIVPDYEQWVKEYCDGKHGEDTYEWDTGIA